LEGDGQTDGRGAADEKPIGDLVQGISEKASFLVREEIELAKAEMEQKGKRFARGAAVGSIAGFFVLLGLIMLLFSAAWAINDLFDGVWEGFLIMAGVLFLLAGLGALFAVRSIKKATPPTPEQAIEEARLIREAIEHPEVQAAMSSEGSEPGR
jgi:uncharacterized membrane protein YqjE